MPFTDMSKKIKHSAGIFVSFLFMLFKVLAILLRTFHLSDEALVQSRFRANSSLKQKPRSDYTSKV